MSYWEAFCLAVVEGLTEFIPVSSTGHLVIATAAMGIKSTDFVKSFTVVVQFGAILSVLLVYWPRFLKRDFQFYRQLLISFLPAAGVGFLFSKRIDELLESVSSVAWALVIGGIGLIVLDRWQSRRDRGAKTGLKQGHILDDRTAFKIGLWQCLALFPGISRSGATIAGGVLSGLTQKGAAEYSFFLAVPTLAAATGYKLLKMMGQLESGHIPVLLFGNLVSFIVGLLAIRGFVAFVSRHGLGAFGVYRVIVGVLILLAPHFGIDLNLV